MINITLTPVRRGRALLTGLALVTCLVTCLAGCRGGQPPTVASAPVVCPPCSMVRQLRSAYQVQPLLAKGDDGRGVTALIVEPDPLGSALRSDLSTFDARTRTAAPPGLTLLPPSGDHPLDSSPSDDLCPAPAPANGQNTEAVGDVETLHAIAPGARIAVADIGGSPTQWLAGLRAALAATHAAVVSMSVGLSEAIIAHAAAHGAPQADPAALRRLDDFFHSETAGHGVTFVVSSGDGGAYDGSGAPSGSCSTNPPLTISASYPGSSPWVLSVGGTRREPTGQETVWNTRSCPGHYPSGDASGGGFSSLEAAPSYQTSPAFRDSLAPAVRSRLRSGRAEPDVSANAAICTGLLYFAGRWTQYGGTSMSTPIWAGLMAIGDQMARRPLGFVNPAIYAMASNDSQGSGTGYAREFTDITSGANSIPGEPFAYPAARGWDPATGWGSPRAENFLTDLIAGASPAPVSPSPPASPSPATCQCTTATDGVTVYVLKVERAPEVAEQAPATGLAVWIKITYNGQGQDELMAQNFQILDNTIHQAGEYGNGPDQPVDLCTYVAPHGQVGGGCIGDNLDTEMLAGYQVTPATPLGLIMPGGHLGDSYTLQYSPLGGQPVEIPLPTGTIYQRLPQGG